MTDTQELKPCYKSMSESELYRHCNTDHRAWAEAFMRCIPDAGAFIDAEKMETWFANAMMAVKDFDRTTPSEVQALVDALEKSVEIIRRFTTTAAIVGDVGTSSPIYNDAVWVLPEAEEALAAFKKGTDND